MVLSLPNQRQLRAQGIGSSHSGTQDMAPSQSESSDEGCHKRISPSVAHSRTRPRR